MSDLTAVSLFAGVGGFDLALRRSGVNVVATVEKDAAAQSVLRHQFPESQHFGDIKEITGEQLRDAGFVSDRGIFTGGFPCQDLSVAGKRAGLAGKRSGLFFEIVRLIDELSPRYFILENVPGLLSSHEGRDFGAVLWSLVERRYGVAYRILDAQFFGVPQRRRRVFIVGCLRDDGRTPFEILALAQGVQGDSSPSSGARPDITNALTTGFGAGGADDNSAQSGHLVPTLTGHHPRNNGGDEHLIAHTLTAEYDASEDGSGRGVPLVAATLTAGGIGKPGVSASGRRQEDDFNLVSFAENQRGELRESDTSLQLTTGGGKPGQGYPAIREGLAVRRLTPVECERLQGFPDDWTAGQSDSARYRQMGNAVAVPVVEWIVKRLIKQDLTRGASSSTVEI